MKAKHNKKRNTAFVYEALLREGTLAILRQDEEKQKKIVSLLRRHFNSDSLLRIDLDCYRSLYEGVVNDRQLSHQIVAEVRKQKETLDSSKLFKEQTSLINDINREISATVFMNYVPNYKTLATIAQMFSSKTSPKNKVILEAHVVEGMLGVPADKQENPEIDDIVYKTLVKKFNEKYDSSLLDEQRELLACYINSFADNALELKNFLNEELVRVSNKLKEASLVEVIKQDEVMIEKTNKLITKLESYRGIPPSEEVISTVLKTQQIVKDIFEDGSYN
tara:strand:- start:1183 stop:2016 length:834 start_codon:yes stop_codon:yes gene_type:complete